MSLDYYNIIQINLLILLMLVRQFGKKNINLWNMVEYGKGKFWEGKGIIPIGKETEGSGMELKKTRGKKSGLIPSGSLLSNHS